MLLSSAVVKEANPSFEQYLIFLTEYTLCQFRLKVAHPGVRKKNIF